MTTANLLATLTDPGDNLEWALTKGSGGYTLHLRSLFGDPGKWSAWRPYDSFSKLGWNDYTQKHAYARFYYKHDYGTDLSLRTHEYETQEQSVEGIEYDYKKHWWSIPKERHYTHVVKAFRIRRRPEREHDLTHTFDFAGSDFSRPPLVQEVQHAASALLAVYASREEEDE